MDDSIVETATLTQNYYLYIKRTLQFLVPLSFFTFLISYNSGFSLMFSYNLQFSTLIFPIFAQALDRKYMFLICNGILALLAKNLKLSSNHDGVVKNNEDEQQIIELPQVLVEATVQENVVCMEYADNPSNVEVVEEKHIEMKTVNQDQDCEGSNEGAKEMKTGSFVLESEDWKEEDDEEEDDEELEVKRVEEGTSLIEEVNDARVSTEELNKKFEEFIRKMKEEIRIEAQQPLITV